MYDRAVAVAAARAQVGTPYRHQGRAAGMGLDCLGLLIVAGKAAGWEPMNPRVVARLNYPAKTVDDKFRTDLEMEAELIRPSSPALLPDPLIRMPRRGEGRAYYEAVAHLVLPGDIALFQMEGAPFPRHVALVSETRSEKREPKGPPTIYIVHSINLSGMNGTFEHALTAQWRARLAGFYRIKEAMGDRR